jgi:small subunit ribosomal protein S9
MELGQLIKDELNKKTSSENKESSIIVEKKERAPKKDAKGRSYGTGRRKKNAVARVWICPGNGKFTVNGKKIEEYFPRATHRLDILTPFTTCSAVNQFDIKCTVKGGGLSGQAGAIRLGIARALDNFNPEAYHALLKKDGLLTRDDRIVERKKYGQHKARKKTQFSKR